MTTLFVLSCSSNGFEDKLCDYMEYDQPDCTDTTYWQTIDLQKVLTMTGCISLPLTLKKIFDK